MHVLFHLDFRLITAKLLKLSEHSRQARKDNFAYFAPIKCKVLPDNSCTFFLRLRPAAPLPPPPPPPPPVPASAPRRRGQVPFSEAAAGVSRVEYGTAFLFLTPLVSLLLSSPPPSPALLPSLPLSTALLPPPPPSAPSRSSTTHHRPTYRPMSSPPASSAYGVPPFCLTSHPRLYLCRSPPAYNPPLLLPAVPGTARCYPRAIRACAIVYPFARRTVPSQHPLPASRSPTSTSACASPAIKTRNVATVHASPASRWSTGTSAGGRKKNYDAYSTLFEGFERFRSFRERSNLRDGF
ncbi:hypothetical protein PUN28_003550 [Cardiocondyla obscurior]|uniref:Uncharacterized protein n=1 Tax=Cardiocondyla obscurior TaxID=286306 RepID=A0AAW2GN14_9HYME